MRSPRAVGQVLADVVGADRQLAVAAVDEHGELDARGPAVVEERLDRGADRAAGVEDVVDEDARPALEREVELRRADERLRVERSLAAADVDVVAVEGDVERAERRPRCRRARRSGGGAAARAGRRACGCRRARPASRSGLRSMISCAMRESVRSSASASSRTFSADTPAGLRARRGVAGRLQAASYGTPSRPRWTELKERCRRRVTRARPADWTGTGRVPTSRRWFESRHFRRLEHLRCASAAARQKGGPDMQPIRLETSQPRDGRSRSSRCSSRSAASRTRRPCSRGTASAASSQAATAQRGERPSKVQQPLAARRRLQGRPAPEGRQGRDGRHRRDRARQAPPARAGPAALRLAVVDGVIVEPAPGSHSVDRRPARPARRRSAAAGHDAGVDSGQHREHHARRDPRTTAPASASTASSSAGTDSWSAHRARRSARPSRPSADRTRQAGGRCVLAARALPGEQPLERVRRPARGARARRARGRPRTRRRRGAGRSRCAGRGSCQRVVARDRRVLREALEPRAAKPAAASSASSCSGAREALAVDGLDRREEAVEPERVEVRGSKVAITRRPPGASTRRDLGERARPVHQVHGEPADGAVEPAVAERAAPRRGPPSGPAPRGTRAAGDVEHLRRRVDAPGLRASLGERRGDAPGAAADVEHAAGGEAAERDEPVEQLSQFASAGRSSS